MDRRSETDTSIIKVCHSLESDDSETSDSTVDEFLMGKRKRMKDPPKQTRKKTSLVIEDPTIFLYHEVYEGKKSMQTVINEWIRFYEVEEKAAILQLIQYFIRCSGCNGKVAMEMYENMTFDRILEKMTDEFDEESDKYPLIMTGARWRRFRVIFCEFIHVWVHHCQIIDDRGFLKPILSFLISLNESKVRAFRHTGALAAMKLRTALISVSVDVSTDLRSIQDQYDNAKRQENRDNGNTNRLEIIMNRRKKLKENARSIQSMISMILEDIFESRYRDVVPAIRSICMSEVSIWMKNFHRDHLRYIGVTLSDSCADVRLSCLQAVLPLYAIQELTEKMLPFTCQFKDRIVAMTCDRNTEVAVNAIKLVINMLKWDERVNKLSDLKKTDIRSSGGRLTAKDKKLVNELVCSANRAVAQAAGKFFYEHLLICNEYKIKDLGTKRGRKSIKNALLIRELINSYFGKMLHEHVEYFMNILIKSNPMLNDWECMTDLLLENLETEELQLDDREEGILIEMMASCVKLSATGNSPAGRKSASRFSAAEVNLAFNDTAVLTRHFISLMHPLVIKYSADPEKLVKLLSIPRYFDLKRCTSISSQEHLNLLLKTIIDTIIDMHTELKVLEACVEILESLCCKDSPIRAECQMSRKNLLDSFVEKYLRVTEHYQQFAAEGGELSADDVSIMTSSLKKVACFNANHDLSHFKLWESLLKWVKLGNRVRHIPEEVVKDALSACFSSVMWELEKLNKVDRTEDGLATTTEQTHSFITVCVEMLNNQNDNLKAEAFIMICDLMICCSKLSQNQKLSCLAYDVDAIFQSQLTKFIQEKVFVCNVDDDPLNTKLLLRRRKNWLSSFCKLIVYDVVSVHIGSGVFQHYVNFVKEYGDIIKWTLQKSMDINDEDTARALLSSLIESFQKLLHNENGTVDRHSKFFTLIKQLAKRFASLFGSKQVIKERAVCSLHSEGIVFALNPLENPKIPGGPPPNMAFLEILCEFTNKLTNHGKEVIMSFLKKKLTSNARYTGGDWQPYVMYRARLSGQKVRC